MRSRAAVLEELRAGRAPEVLIIGAGINGVGVYWDLALQGVAALMIDQADICSGTSAASSRLIHGGLRYLEIGEFALVRESVRERNRLLLDAPHYVRALSVWVPIETLLGGFAASFGRFLRLVKAPGAKGSLVVKLGLMIYDLFGRADQTMPRHRMVTTREFRQAMPDLAPSTRYMAEYYDARLTAPERLGLELVGDAEAACPESLALPYARLVGRIGGQVVFEDQLSGERFTVAPRLVVNCAGAWLDQTDASLGIEMRLIGGTKGSHVVLRNPDFAAKLAGRMIYFETPDHRICLAYPLDGQNVLLGTTDIRTDDPNDTIISMEEVHYLFDVMRSVMPSLELSIEQIVFTYAGVRPLPRSDGVAGAISRDHSIRTFEPEPDHPYPIVALVGGKWTTFRACAEQVTDEVLARLGRTRQRSTLGVAIGAGAGFPTSEHDRLRLIQKTAESTRVSPKRVEALLDRYGMRAVPLIEAASRMTETILTHLPGYSAEEILAIARDERVSALADVVLRRTQIALLGLASPEAVTEVGSIVGQALGWTPEQIVAEVKATLDCLTTHHGLPGQHTSA